MLQVKYDARQRMDGLALLRALPDGCAAAAIFDPQHRSVLDQMNYGNEGARQAGRAALPAMTEGTITRFLGELQRVVRPTGHVFLWIDKFCLASGKHNEWLDALTKLTVVDLLCWDKIRIGMGRRLRCSTEYMLVVQRLPARAAGIWTDHSLRDSWAEYADREVHPHAKPVVLLERLIRACTKKGDLIVDPCAGSYGTLLACTRTGRRFVGCDVHG